MAAKSDALPMDFKKPMPAKGVRRGGIYDRTVTAFLESGEKHAEVGGETSAQSRYLGLKGAIKRLAVEEKVSVSRIMGEVWLYVK